MNIPVWARVGVLVLLAMCASAVTTSLSGRFRFASVSRAAEAPSPKKGVAGPRIAEMHLDAMNVSMENGRVVANARASLFDRRNDVAYVWNLAAIDESTRETVAQKLYKDQIFDFAGGRNAHPTFSDGLDLPAGRYRVMLTLYEVPRNTGFDIDSLKDREKSKGQRVLVGVGKIEVP